MRSTLRITVPRYERVEETGPVREDGQPAWRSWKSVQNGSRTGVIVLDIDVDAIARTLGARTLRNKTRRATALHGLIVAKARDVADIP